MILLVEDDESTRQVICDFLDSLGIPYRAAADVEEGLALMRSMHPNILLTDLLLGGNYTSRPLIEECQKNYPHCKSILITASDKRRAEEAALGLKVDHLLLKPFNVDEFEQVIRKFLRDTAK